MEKLYKIRDMLVDEVKGIADKKELTSSSLDTIECCAKCYEKINEMIHSLQGEYGGYSEGMPMRYSSSRRPYDYRDEQYSGNGMRYGNYSYGMDYGDDRKMIIQKLESIMNESRNDHDRHAIMEAIETLRK